MAVYNVEGHEPSILPDGKEWKLVWHDEFDGSELDKTKWGFRTGFWGRRFKTYTTDEAIEMRGDSCIRLHLIERDGHYYSAQLQTGGNCFDNPREDCDRANCGGKNFWPLGRIEEPKFMHRYGYYECRCKLQTQPGWWSAFWLQSPNIGTTYYPETSGVEVDIMENFTRDGLITSGNLTLGYGVQGKREGRVKYQIDNPTDFHRYGVHWSPEGYVFYCDGKETSRANKYVSHVEQFILLTTECYGYRMGNMDTPCDELKTAVLPDCFTVDYVRVFDEV